MQITNEQLSKVGRFVTRDILRLEKPSNDLEALSAYYFTQLEIGVAEMVPLAVVFAAIAKTFQEPVIGWVAGALALDGFLRIVYSEVADNILEARKQS